MSGATVKRDCLLAARTLFAFTLLFALTQFANGQREEAETGRPQFGVTLIAFSNDGRKLAVVRGSLNKQRFDHYDGFQRYSGYFGYNSEIEVWDLTSGKLAQHLKEFKGPVLSATFSPDGGRLATGSWEVFDVKPVAKSSDFRRTFGVVKVWDLKAGGLVWSQKAYNTDVSGVAYAPDGKTLASSGTRRSPNFAVGEVKVWDAMTGGLIRTLEYRTPVSGLAFSPDGKTLAVRKSILNESKGEVKLCDVQTWKEGRTLKADRGITMVEAMRSIVFSPDGKTMALAITGLDGDEIFSEIQLWDTAKGKLARSLLVDKRVVKGHDRVPRSFWRISARLIPSNRPTASMTFSVDGKTIFAINDQIQMKAWDVESGAVKIIGKSQGEVASVALSPDGMTVAAGEYDNNVRLWETSSGKLKQKIAGSAGWTGTFSADSLVVSVDSILAVAFFPDGKTLAGATSNKVVKLWETSQSIEKKSLNGHSDRVSSIAVLPDRMRLLSGSSDQTAKLWDAETGEVLKTFVGHSGAVTSVASSPDGRLAASASADKSIKIWDLVSGELKLTLRGHDGGVLTVAFSPDGKTLASGSLDSTIRLWDVETGQPKPIVVRHQSPVNSVAFSPDGKSLASGGLDKTVRLWDAETGELRKTMTGHDLSVNCVAFSPDGSVIASASDDKTVRLWHTQSGTARRTLKGHDISVFSVGFSPDGKTLASGSGNNSLVIWDWQTGELKRVIKDSFKVQVRGQREN
ncbi:MAG TPA: hypothetical protein VKA70_19340 [Blastocatellia bacterium]|nr:hypothetical protein [Blastocatellia bacterium]